jgi:phage tail sheath gpL-like
MGIDVSAAARVIGVEVQFVNLSGGAIFLLPQQVALIGQGNTAATYALTPAKYTTAAAVGAAYGFGSPLHLAALKLLPINGGGLGTIPLTVYPMVDDAAGAVAAGSITPAGTHVGNAEYRVIINGVRSAAFTIADGEVFGDLEDRITTAINAEVSMPVIAAAGIDVVDLTSKWEGLSANDIKIAVDGPSQGITFGLVQPVGGLVDPDVDDALAIITTKWETMAVSCLQAVDATLDKYATWGEPRWGSLVQRPVVVFTGTAEPVLATVTAIGDGRKTDRVNATVYTPGVQELPCQIAAAGVAKSARQANNNPPVDYAGQLIDVGTVPPAVIPSLTYAERDTAIKAGVSTSEVSDQNVSLSDTVTFYHPDGEVPPAYRYVVDIVKLQNLVFNLQLIFEADEWKGAPLIPNEQPTVNPRARKPKDAVAAVAALVDSAALQAILSDPETAKSTITAVIDGTNPKRLNVAVTVQLSGNSNIIDVTLNFGFFFGTPAVL